MTATVKLTITEKEWMAQVLDLARLFGWATYHPFLSIHSARGWPDLALVRPPRLILAELKSQTGKLTPDQERWLALLEGCETRLYKAGVEVYVWRPSQLDQVQAVLR